jgi:hypothetical protein
MVAQLGGKCCDCGATDNLEFDCLRPMGRRHHGMDTSARMCFYRKQFRAGNIKLRCSRCNSLKGALSEADWQTLRRSMLRDEALNAAGSTSPDTSNEVPSTHECPY